MKFLTPARVTLLMLLVVGGLIAAYVAKNIWAGGEPEVVERRNIPMLLNDIPAGTLITERDLGLGPYPSDTLPPDAFINKDVIVGRIARVDLKRATPIRGDQLFRFGEQPPLPISSGMQAVTVAIGESDDVVDGHVMAGDYVDLHLTPTTTRDPRLRGGLTLTVFRGIKVLAMNQGRSRSGVDRGGNTVTLELTARQSNIAIQAEKAGDLTLSLNPDGRGATGVDVSRDDRATLEEILDLPPLPEPQKPFRTRTYRGSGFGVLQFDDEGRHVGNGYNFNNNNPQSLPNNLNYGPAVKNDRSDDVQPNPAERQARTPQLVR